jgi:hypothetical protein
MLAICFQVYILSFAIELRHAYVHAPKLKLIAIYDESTMSVKSGQLGCCGLGLKTVSIEKSVRLSIDADKIADVSQVQLEKNGSQKLAYIEAV